MKRLKRYTVFPHRGNMRKELNTLEICYVRRWFDEGPNILRRIHGFPQR